MTSRLQRALDKLTTYIQKLDASPYYLAARIFDPENRISFLQVEDEDKKRMLTSEGAKKLCVVRKLWERFRDKIPLSARPNESGKYALKPKEDDSTFHKTRREHKQKKTRPQSQDEFDTYIGQVPIELDSCTTP